MPYFSRWCRQGRFWLPEPLLRLLEQRLLRKLHGAIAADLAKVICREHFFRTESFCLDRRALISMPEFEDVTEWAMRQAIRLLEETGFVERRVTFLLWRMTGEGPRRKPIQFRIAGYFRRLLDAARACARTRKVTSSHIQGLSDREAAAPLSVTQKSPSCIWEEVHYFRGEGS
jgi:hypothetical protein